jgi:hypothetical protein
MIILYLIALAVVGSIFIGVLPAFIYALLLGGLFYLSGGSDYIDDDGGGSFDGGG